MKRFILKVDDFRLNESLTKFHKLIQLCLRHSAPLSIGVIGAALRGGRFQLQQLFSQLCSSGQIELWNHSYSHRDMTQMSDMEVAWEIAATTSASLRQLGHRPVGFGAPFNKCDDRIALIAREQGLEFVYERAFSTAQLVTPEYNVPFDGQPNLDEFVKRVERKRDLDTLIVQVHPGRWLSRGFEHLDKCLSWLREQGYEAVTVRDALGLESTADGRRVPVGVHELLVSRLEAYWKERAPEYDASLSNFSSYFLGRFRANSPGILQLLERLDADLAPRSVVDVGCGLAQWSLPFFEFNKEATVWTFDTNKVLSQALLEASKAGLIPYELRVANEDYTISTKLPAHGIDRIVCANALNYIPILAFAQQSRRVCKDGAQVILLNQTGAFNHVGVVDALHAGNLAMAMERGLSELRQQLVRLGFAGFMPARTTHNVAELEAIFHAFGFQLRDDFIPAWERTFRGLPTFQGSVFLRHTWIEPTALAPAVRPEYRKLLCQAGFTGLDDEVFPGQVDDLKELELGRLKARSGHERADDLDVTLAADLELGRLIRDRSFTRARELVSNTRVETPDWLFAGTVAALLDGDPASAERLARRLDDHALPEQTRGLLKAMCCLVADDAAGAASALADDRS
jgi:peptidoglycan/xylan/chitin deacetylase (PgdA/CDA1 family)/SAM-dependent methyltransferase